MNHYLYQLKPTRANMLSDGPSVDEAAIIEQHFQYLMDLTNQKIVLMAGRTLTEDETTFGIVLLQAESESAASQIMAGDPAVAKNVMQAVLFPFGLALWADSNPLA